MIRAVMKMASDVMTWLGAAAAVPSALAQQTQDDHDPHEAGVMSRIAGPGSARSAAA